eukprot:TRINITY_DN3198_c0_g2_i3.p3 TRINITY_DN3198_c0_g2~~TRINITY_DN3198_c0_g2_i3.p3  ORF type:complete len:108 (+),score=30.48 TRINITY_DN3198_c0_g2_i3:88-411(+)
MLRKKKVSSGQTLGVKAQRFRGHTSPHRNVKEKKSDQPTSQCQGKKKCKDGAPQEYQVVGKKKKKKKRNLKIIWRKKKKKKVQRWRPTRVLGSWEKKKKKKIGRAHV